MNHLRNCTFWRLLQKSEKNMVLLWRGAAFTSLYIPKQFHFWSILVYVCTVFSSLEYFFRYSAMRNYVSLSLFVSIGTDPSKHYISVYRSLAAIWIVFGLAWLALIFNLGADLMEKFLQFNKQKPDPGTTEVTVFKGEDNPDQPRIYIPSWVSLMGRQLRTTSVCIQGVWIWYTAFHP